MSSLSLRPITLENSATTLPQTLQLVKDLAAYEKEPDAVEATVELLRESFFGDAQGTRYAQGVLAYQSEEDTEPVGMAIYYFTFSTWTGRGGLYLEDLFVKESARGLGVGKALFRYLGQICKEKKLPRMDWVVLDWNEPAKAVYKKMGAVHKKEWEGMRLEGEALAKLAE